MEQVLQGSSSIWPAHSSALFLVLSNATPDCPGAQILSSPARFVDILIDFLGVGGELKIRGGATKRERDCSLYRLIPQALFFKANLKKQLQISNLKFFTQKTTLRDVL